MQGRNTLLTREAIYDIADIAEYIEVDFGIDRADEFQNDIKEQINLLFYVIKEQEVHILRVLREERDWESILRKEQRYTYPN